MDASIYKTRFRWSTQIKDVVDFNSYYRVTVKAENINDPGSLVQIKIGYYLEDELGNRFTITGVNIGGYIERITVIDEFKYGFGPRDGEGVVYESVDLGDAPLIGPVKYENLDVSALSRALGIDMDIIWRNLYHYWRLSSEKIKYGYLYNRYALNQKIKSSIPEYGYLYNGFAVMDSRGIAPAGWHVPTDADWAALLLILSDNYQGHRLREAGLEHWQFPNSGATDEFGFCLRGNGSVLSVGSPIFSGLMTSALLHSSQSKTSTFHGAGATLSTDYFGDIFQNVGGGGNALKIGAGVRLIKDDSTEVQIMTDYDGNTYKTVNIGGQIWMASNLIVAHYNNGDAITKVTNESTWTTMTSGGFCAYDFNDANAIKIITTTIAAYNAHVPSATEWQTLSDSLGGDTVSGGKLKEAGIIHWTDPNTDADNSSGFTAVGAGNRDAYGIFNNLKLSFSGWVLDEIDPITGESVALNYDDGYLNSGTELKAQGNSVRLIVDFPNIINPDLVTGQYFGNDSRVYECALMPDGKWWTIENSIETKYNDGSPIPEVVDPTEWSALTTGARCSYDNNPLNAYDPKLRVFSKNFVNFVDSETISWTKTQVSPTEIQITAMSVFDYTTYVLPIATTVAGGNILGGVVIGDNLSINPTTGVLSASDPMVYPSGTGLAYVSAGSSWGPTVTIGSGLYLDATTHVLSATTSGGMIWPASAGVAYYAGSSAWGSCAIGAGLALTGTGGAMTLSATGTSSMVYPVAGIALSTGTSGPWDTSLTWGSGLKVVTSVLQTDYPTAGIVNSSGSSWGTVTIGTGLAYVSGVLSATTGPGIMVYPTLTGFAWVNSGSSWGTTITIGSGLTISGSVLSASSMVWPPTTTAGLAYYTGLSSWNTSLTIGAGLAIVGGALTATGGGSMVYPPVGIPISTGPGGGWGSSLNPSANNYKLIRANSGGTGFEFSAISGAGLAISDGNNWITPIAIAVLNIQANIYTITANDFILN